MKTTLQLSEIFKLTHPELRHPQDNGPLVAYSPDEVKAAAIVSGVLAILVTGGVLLVVGLTR